MRLDTVDLMRKYLGENGLAKKVLVKIINTTVLVLCYIIVFTSRNTIFVIISNMSWAFLYSHLS